MPSVSALHRLPAGAVDLLAIPTDATPAFPSGDKDEAVAALAAMGPESPELQEKLYAERTAGATRNVLLVLQGMDTSGKGGVLEHTVGLIPPAGVKAKSFKAPTDEEKAHDFLWRIRNALPDPGQVGVFDRSHYEDVLIVKVHQWAPAEEIERRYAAIRDFEAELIASGTTILKCMLHISAETQKERLLARLDDPGKHWKFNPGDIDERAHWAEYRSAYERALRESDTDQAPRYVIPSDNKWYRNYAIGVLLLEALRGLDPQWPAADFDVAHERQRLMVEPHVL